MNQQEDRELINPPSSPRDQPPPLHQNAAIEAERESPRSNHSRSRSRSRSKSHHFSEVEDRQIRPRQSMDLSKNEEPIKNSNEGSLEIEGKERPKMKKDSSKVINSTKEVKKKKLNKQYLTDFSDFLPEALIYVTKTNIVSKIRVGPRYQADIPSIPPLISLYRPMDQWLVWGGASSPQEKPSEEHIKRFKEILGGNRNEQELIAMRSRLGMCGWNRVLDWAQGRRTELRWTYHQNQRNRAT